MALRFAPARGAAFSLTSFVRGPTGAAATVAVGTTTTGSAGSSASVSNSGSSSAATFNFTIPRGADCGMRYAFETSTSMAAPASGGLRLNNATISSVTAMAVNASNSDGIDVSDWVATWDDSTATVKGYVELRKEGSGSVLALFRITSVTDNTTWLQFALTYVSGSGSLSASDPVYLTPYRTGDAGTGDFSSNTSTSVDSEIVLFSGTGGKTGKRATGSGVATVTSGVLGVSGTGTTATFGTIELGAATDTTISRASAGVIAVEGVNLTANIPQTPKSTAYTTVLADANTHILHPAADNNARTFTIDSNANVAYPIGTCLTFVNEINTVTIAITSDTLTLAGPGSTGSRTLAANGIATAMKITTTKWIISGTGLT